MTPGEIASYIGAAAWLPQLLNIFYKYITKPKLRVFFNNTAEISYTSFGPILNIRMGMLTEKKSLLLEEISLQIKHSDGDVHHLKWAGITEIHSEISDQNGNKQVISKDQPPIALKLFQDLLTEKFIKFQEPKYHAQDTILLNELNAHVSFLANRNTSNITAEALASPQLHNIIAYRENFFWWKKGKYTVSLQAKSPDRFSFEGNTFSFSLNQTEIDLLKFNMKSLSEFLDAQVAKKEEITNIKWNWINPKITKEQ
ncbi:hypothetical protein [Enterobacter vonholyi]|uniref:hypothetical protein n=1 Tax=Enterobacter vonholyi TaxID=2797505 RepID=UPI00333035D4